MIQFPLSKRQFAELRNELGLDRGELANALGLSEKHIERYETGLRPIPELTAKLMIMYVKHGIPPAFMRRAA